MKAGIKILIFVFVLCVFTTAFTACKKKKSSTSDTTPTPTTPAPAVIDINHESVVKYSVEGTAFSYPSAGISGGMGTSLSLASSMDETSTASYDYGFSGGTATYFSVAKGTIHTPGIGRPDENAFRAFFVVGNVNYSPDNLNGIKIKHRDSDGIMWTTDKGSGNQTGSVFKIEAVKETNNGYQNVKVYATFNCKLYNDNGNSKTLTNGKFVGYFENN